jgi:phage shock protein A
MFSAIANLFKKLGYLLTGKVDSASDSLASNPQVIRANFDRIIDEKKARIGQYKDAVARMIAQEENKLARIKDLTGEIERLEQLKEGAAAKARSVVEWLKGEGKSMEEIKANEDYQRCLAAFNDFSSSLKEKEQHVAELEADVKELETTIGHHKVQLQGLLREIDKIKQESSETVADVITAREEQQINDMLAGVSTDRTGRELEELRELRQQAKAGARVSRELAGTDTKVQEEEFLQYATKSAAANEFDQLIGLAEKTDAATSAPQERAEPVRLPEN